VEIQRRIDRIVRWIQHQVTEAGARGAVLGMSGGVDSSVAAALCKRALGEEALGLILPCHSAPQDIEDAHWAAKAVGIRTEMVDLTPVYDLLLRQLPPGGRAACANLKPRLRMTCLYYYANLQNLLVVGTSNASELAAGYFTKYGDGGADILPIGSLLKREVKELAHVLGIPQRIIQKSPSAGLWKGQTDEGELGLTYEQMDRYLAGGRVPPQTARRIEQLMAASVHKKRPPLIFQDP